MFTKPSRFFSYTAGIVLSGIIGCAGLPHSSGSSTIILPQSMYFTTPEGAAQEVPPGSYLVTKQNHAALVLTQPAGKPQRILAATPFSHKESLASELAIALPPEGTDDHYHVVLLFPDGSGLDAAGSSSGIASRATTPALVSTARLRLAKPGLESPLDRQGLNPQPLPPRPQPGAGFVIPFVPASPAAPPPFSRSIDLRTGSLQFPRPTPALDGLLQTMANQPGGQAILGEAARRGAALVFAGQAVYTIDPGIKGQFESLRPLDVALSLCNPATDAAGLMFDAVNVRWDCGVESLGPGTVGYLHVHVPRTGFYLFDMELRIGQQGAKLPFYAATPSGSQLLQTWDFPPAAQEQDAHATGIFRLEQGKHYWIWNVPSGGMVWYRLHIKEMPSR